MKTGDAQAVKTNRVAVPEWVPLVAAVLLSGLAYANSFGGDFVFDDIPLIRDSSFVQDLGNAGRMIPLMAQSEGQGYRPVRTWSHFLEFQIFGLNPVGYHVTNVILHIIVCLLLYRLARRLGLSDMASLAGMVLFAVHPVHTEAVTYISGRRDLLCALFFIGGALSYVSGVQDGKRLLVVLTVPLYVLSVFSKELGITLPALLFCWELIVYRSNKSWGRRIVSTFCGQSVFWVVIFAGAVSFFVYRGLLIPRTHMLDWWGDGPLSNFATVFAIHARYLLVQVWPANLIVDYSRDAFPLAQSFLDGRTLAGCAIFVGSLGLAIGQCGRRRFVSFAVVSYWILLLPVSHFIPHHELAAEHHLYLSSAVLCFASGAGFVFLMERWKKTAIVFLFTLAILLTGLTLSRNRVWQSEDALWTEAVTKAPRCARALFNLAVVRIRQGDLVQAEELLRRSGKVVPNERTVAYLGHVLSKKGEQEEADRILREAYRRYPGNKFVAKYYAQNLVVMRRASDAIPVLEKGIERWPGDADMHFMLGGCYFFAKEKEKALLQNLDVLRYRPRDEKGLKFARYFARELGFSELLNRLDTGWRPSEGEDVPLR